MKIAPGPDTNHLLEFVRQGNQTAREQVLARHRDRLRKMVAFHMDRRLAARFDPSDVVQEALAEADRRLDEYVREPPLPFYPWLRQIAWDRLIELRRRHLRAAKRSVLPELPSGSQVDERGGRYPSAGAVVDGRPVRLVGAN
jgi:RNA polymerase sigma-70 factor (ECF subfamily)